MSRPRPILIVNINLDPRTLDGCRAIDEVLRELAPAATTRIVPWRAIDARAAARLRPRAVVLGPNATPFPAYPPQFDRFLAWVRGRRGPTLGICGGHQALALAHGSPVGPVHPVPAARRSYARMPKVRGEIGVRLLGDPDPLLDGLATEITVHASHVDEVKEIPPGFRLLAVGDPCHIQAMRADRRPSWGVQFHPERGGPGSAGRRLLQNWLRAVLRGGPAG